MGDAQLARRMSCVTWVVDGMGMGGAWVAHKWCIRGN